MLFSYVLFGGAITVLCSAFCAVTGRRSSPAQTVRETTAGEGPKFLAPWRPWCGLLPWSPWRILLQTAVISSLDSEVNAVASSGSL